MEQGRNRTGLLVSLRREQGRYCVFSLFLPGRSLQEKIGLEFLKSQIQWNRESLRVHDHPNPTSFGPSSTIRTGSTYSPPFDHPKYGGTWTL